MTITVSGQTFIYREHLKELGGRYDSVAKNWKFDYLSKSRMQELRLLPGCLVTEDDPQTAEDFIKTIIKQENENPAKERIGATIFRGDDKEYFNKFRDKNPIVFSGFSSLSKFVEYIDATPERLRKSIGWDESGTVQIFSGSSSMSHALDLARKGWNEGIENAEKISKMLTVSHAVQRRRKHSVFGGSVSVGRMLAGNPVNMISRPRQHGKKVITLFVQNNGPSIIKAKQMLARSAICCAVVDLLEANGYSCEIVSVSTNRAPRGVPADHQTVKIKNAGERVNIADIAFTLGHPSFLRRLSFAAIGNVEELRFMWQSMGVSVSAFGELEANEYHMPHLENNYPGDTLEEIAKAMLSDVLPAGLPIDIEG